jgi:hypothetical protein
MCNINPKLKVKTFKSIVNVGRPTLFTFPNKLMAGHMETMASPIQPPIIPPRASKSNNSPQPG